MARLPVNVLVLPFVRESNGPRYAVFHRADWPGCWQGIAGGVEEGESHAQAASREAWEEAGVPRERPLLPLDARASIPASYFRAARDWGAARYVVEEVAFGLELGPGDRIVLSHEHSEQDWLSVEEALVRLMFEHNRIALWELHLRLTGLAAYDPEAHALWSAVR